MFPASLWFRRTFWWVCSETLSRTWWDDVWTWLDTPVGSDGDESTCNTGDLGSIPGSGRSPREGNGNPLQYSCLENSMDRGAFGATVHGGWKESDWQNWVTNTLTFIHCHLMRWCINLAGSLSRGPRRNEKQSSGELWASEFQCLVKPCDRTPGFLLTNWSKSFMSASWNFLLCLGNQSVGTTSPSFCLP